MLILPEAIDASQMYKLLIGAVTPRPIAWVSSMSQSGQVNLAPFSFFTVASANPPVLCFNPLYRGAREEKDTLANIREQNEFVVNTVSYRDLEVMNLSCHDLPPGHNEFEYANVASEASSKVAPPRVANSVASFECRLNQIVDLGDQALSGHLVLGDVVAVHVQDSAIEDYRIDSDQLDAIGRMAGTDYTLTRERVQLKR
ncbi:flavin reductase family protein [Arenicella xantha]|uniref:Flavin reductase (DIM6/NTAB) family NADH-FMN oxidoreductase RutF n=1 Tax=Arenicella xantha TaxID=644221 RepID=A0A395JSM6_9GAMM|nr:flavin reductase family protein [Arenicella xantha]RBP53352.1 flavin reductase (DIM6/NTAB) family NADH-FMN oxidoreductase RutF [Arenicella xantha]